MPPTISGPATGSIAAWGLAALLLAATVAAPSAARAENTTMIRDDHGRLTVPENSPMAARLAVAPVTLTKPSRAIPVPGAIMAEPARSISVQAPLAGHIVSLPVAPGDHVTRGQVVAELLSGDMAQATTDEVKARAALDLARRALTRAQGVAQAGGGAVRDIEAARSTYLQAVAEDDRATARLAALGGQPGGGGTMKLVSPVDGVVSTVNTAAGANVTDPTAPLLTIADTREVWAVANVPENEVATIQAGQQADIYVPGLPGEVLHGAIAAIEPTLHADTRTLQARVVLPNADGALKPNMFATVTVEAPQSPRIMVPQSALLMNNDTVTVFVEVAPHTYMRRNIDIIYDDGDLCEVDSGLSAGERIVTQGAVLLNDD
ncbi:efflux RND transporter periplasmic adaptor subunit [Gluconacetobacter diazotrophicus]|nr:efflux RND transporter periplasmic adaptor subunit [Gluconacetobacter diazotrophicus]